MHKTVPVTVGTKVDAFALRIWNVMQGLRTLRETGMTRELELWGVVGGEVVNGVVDEVYFGRADEEPGELAQAKKKSSKDRKEPGQLSVTSFLDGNNGTKDTRRRKVYLTDVKTRGTKSIPGTIAFRPTLYQLMLYKLVLSDLATDKVDSKVIFDRYSLNPNEPFSEYFINSIASLNGISSSAEQPQSSDPSTEPSSAAPSSTQDSLFSSLNDDLLTLLENNSLSQLCRRMIKDFEITLPDGANSIADVLKAEYRSSSTGDMMGEKTFVYDQEVVEKYVEDEMKWWRGERKARGVEVEEAYKCRSCEFGEECEWRKEKEDEAIKAFRAKAQAK